MFETEAKTDVVEENTHTLRGENEFLTNVLNAHEQQIQKSLREQNDLQQYSRLWNVRGFGLPVRQLNHCTKKCCGISNQKVKVKTEEAEIEVAHRTGTPSGTKCRPILVRFFDRKKRDQILANRRNLKNRRDCYW